jgi:hypothetical protein
MSKLPQADLSLLEAVAEADVAKVRQLISQRANLNACISLKHRAHMGANAGTVGLSPLGITIVQRELESDWVDLSEHPEEGARGDEREAIARRAALLAIAELLADSGADLNFMSSVSLAKSPLYSVAAYNDLEMIQLLLRHGAKRESTGALHAAAYGGHIEAVEALIAAGLDVNEKLGGMTALEMLERPATESEYVWNFGPEWEEEEAKKEKEREVRREKIKLILRRHK